MEKPTKVVINCETGVSEILELTDEEIAQRKADAAAWETIQAQKQAELEAQAEVKASALAKLEALGLTEEEATALIS